MVSSHDAVFSNERKSPMTTIETLTISQIHALEAVAGAAGDDATARDCATVYTAYIESTLSTLLEVIEQGAVREAALRIVAVIRDAEAQLTTIETLTEEQIRALRDEADRSGDREMSRQATYALDNWCHKAFPTPAADEAAEVCLRAIRAAEAHQCGILR